jgi:TetR/AcrR family transcriptional repressor of nem operon
MGRKGQATRDKLLEVAEQSILQKGFAGTSIDDVIREVGITKGGFFYHFSSKDDLAVALLERYREQDALLFSGMFSRAAELSDDPLQQMLIFLKLLSETMENLEALHPGCLVGSFTYESQIVNQQVRDLTADCILDWRHLFERQITCIAAQYPLPEDTSASELADMLSTIIEGGIIVSRAINDPQILVRQLLNYRSFVKLTFASG